MTIRDLLSKQLSKKELAHVPTSFDIIGNKEKAVAIIEIPPLLQRRKKLIAKAIMEMHRNVKTVLEKASPRRGKFRTRKYKLIAGSRNTEVVHHESGCRFLLDPRRVYFSGRESTERVRIASAIKKNENVMVFFAGIGPFAIIIAKKSPAKKITGIEINPDAVKYFRENILLNKIKNVDVILGDVKKKTRGKYDRILMPLPEKSLEYLNEAFLCSRKGTVIHLYFFSREDEIEIIKKKVREKAQEYEKKIRCLRTQKVLPYGPKTWKMRLDIRMLKS